MVASLVIAGAFALIAGVATWQVVRLQRIEIAEANARQAEAELKLAEIREKVGRPRRVDIEAFVAAVKDVKPLPVEVSVVTTDPDSHWLSSSIWSGLEKAGWPIIQNGAGFEMFRQTPPLIRTCAGQVGGVTVLSKTISEEESAYLSTIPRPDQRPKKPFLAVWGALWDSMGANEVGFATCPFVPDGQLHIVVAPRWIILPPDKDASADPAKHSK